jgi:hypothetical protein
MINNLFHKLRQTLSKQYGSNSAIVPFALGRVYQTAYRNYHHDPRPLLFIIGSDAFHTVGINVHYLGGFAEALTTFIITLRQSQVVLTGLVMYQLLKTRIPMIPKVAFRKYFTAMLRGKLVSEGISTLPEPNILQFLAEPWVRRLNNLIRPKQFSFNKVRVDDQNTESVRNQVIQTQYYSDKSRPFADRNNQNIVQYRRPQ